MWPSSFILLILAPSVSMARESFVYGLYKWRICTWRSLCHWRSCQRPSSPFSRGALNFQQGPDIMMKHSSWEVNWNAPPPRLWVYSQRCADNLKIVPFSVWHGSWPSFCYLRRFWGKWCVLKISAPVINNNMLFLLGLSFLLGFCVLFKTKRLQGSSVLPQIPFIRNYLLLSFGLILFSLSVQSIHTHRSFIFVWEWDIYHGVWVEVRGRFSVVDSLLLHLCP